MLRVNGIEHITAAGNDTLGNISDQKEDQQGQQGQDNGFQKVFEAATEKLRRREVKA